MRDIMVVSSRALSGPEYEAAINVVAKDVVKGEVGPFPLKVTEFVAAGTAFVIDGTGPDLSDWVSPHEMRLRPWLPPRCDHEGGRMSGAE